MNITPPSLFRISRRLLIFADYFIITYWLRRRWLRRLLADYAIDAFAISFAAPPDSCIDYATLFSFISSLHAAATPLLRRRRYAITFLLRLADDTPHYATVFSIFSLIVSWLFRLYGIDYFIALSFLPRQTWLIAADTFHWPPSAIID